MRYNNRTFCLSLGVEDCTAGRIQHYALNDISSDAYYEIWHSKYSEPGQLRVAENYRMMPNALNCLLASYKAGNRSAIIVKVKLSTVQEPEPLEHPLERYLYNSFIIILKMEDL